MPKKPIDRPEKRRTTIWLAPVDDESIETIRRRWSLDSDSAAIRFAVRVVAASSHLEVILPPNFDPKEVTDND
jgi:hypothetical protein